jgi:hypothetical protein
MVQPVKQNNHRTLRFYVGYVMILLLIVYGVERFLGTLYARYVIIYSGAIFMAGLLVGQRYEQAWLTGRSSRGVRSPAAATGSDNGGRSA